MTGLPATTNDAPRAAIARARRRHGVLAVITTRVTRQQALPVAEDHAVLFIRERASGQNQSVRLLSLRWKFTPGDLCLACHLTDARRVLMRPSTRAARNGHTHAGCQPYGDPKGLLQRSVDRQTSRSHDGTGDVAGPPQPSWALGARRWKLRARHFRLGTSDQLQAEVRQDRHGTEIWPKPQARASILGRGEKGFDRFSA